MRDETFVQLRLKTSTITSENTEEWQDEIKLATIGNTNKEVQLQNRNYNLNEQTPREGHELNLK